MNEISFAGGTVKVGSKDVAFAPRVIHGRFQMYVPNGFVEDENLVSNYTYLFSKDKSPLSIAIKYSAVSSEEDQAEQILCYFNQAIETLDSAHTATGGLHYREKVTESKYLSVYSLRFALAIGGGLLFGCFNCSASYKDDWRPVVLAMLRNATVI